MVYQVAMIAEMGVLPAAVELKTVYTNWAQWGILDNG